MSKLVDLCVRHKVSLFSKTRAKIQPYLRVLTALVAAAMLFLTSCQLQRLERPDCVNKPSANFLMDTAACETPCTVRFSNTSSEATSFKWVFGNGNASDRRTPPPQYYIQGGLYSISLVAENENGCQDTITKQLVVTKPFAYQLPVAAFTSDKITCKSPCTITFNNNSVNATEFIWNFGDGTPPVKPSDPATISHRFEQSGRLPVSLTASNPKWSHTDTLWITITTNTFVKSIDHKGLKTSVNAVRPTLDRGYIMVGSVEVAPNNNKDAWIAKIDSNGTVMWSEAYDYSPDDGFRDVQALPNGDYAVIGTFNSDLLKPVNILFVKINAFGTQIGKHKILGNLAQSEIPSSLIVNPSGEFIFAGIGNPAASTNPYFFAFKLNAQGDSIWMVKTNPNQNESKAPRNPVRIAQHKNGGYVFSGNHLNSVQGSSRNEMVIGSVSENGQMNWLRPCGRTALATVAHDLKQLPNGGFLLAGDGSVAGINNSDKDLYLVKTDETGQQIDDLLIQKSTANQSATGVELLPNDQYIVMGTDNAQIFMRRIAWNKQMIWERTYTKTGNNSAVFLHRVASDGGYVLAGNDNTNAKVWVIKTDGDGNEK